MAATLAPAASLRRRLPLPPTFFGERLDFRDREGVSG